MATDKAGEQSAALGLCDVLSSAHWGDMRHQRRSTCENWREASTAGQSPEPLPDYVCEKCGEHNTLHEVISATGTILCRPKWCRSVGESPAPAQGQNIQTGYCRTHSRFCYAGKPCPECERVAAPPHTVYCGLECNDNNKHFCDCKCHTAERVAAPPEPGFDEATETRWQNAIYELCKKTVGPANDHLIDGGGSDSGDALDFTLAEIGQAIGFWRDKAEEIAPQADAVKQLHDASFYECGRYIVPLDDADAIAAALQAKLSTIERAITEFLLHDGGRGSKDWDAAKNLKNRERLIELVGLELVRDGQ